MSHACCAVRGVVVVLGGQLARFLPGEDEWEDCFTASVENLGYDSETEEKIFLFRRCHAAHSSTQLRSQSTSRAKLSSSAGATELLVNRRCARLTWRLGCALRFLLSFLPDD
jgi:hypothetical protein